MSLPPYVPLVADGLLPDPRHHPLHPRPRRGLAPLEPLRPARPLRSRLCARLVVADPENEGGHRRGTRTLGARTRPTYSWRTIRVIYDTPVVFSAASRSSFGSSRRRPFPAFRSSAGISSAADTCSSTRKSPDRPGILRRWRALVSDGLSLIIYAEGTRSTDGRVARFKAGSASSWRLKPVCRSCRFRWRGAGS